ncbi:trace amine-associated receptor 13c-like [Alosa sapidissima]|uniref:trace amine-associated receptor 13c-like n=1 Tax=Alosa sapidissima TaxID=34773 RepID=UPI001C093620|nr:trace amine-associated receptor 13c-like [Alosa sapidissima]
MKNLTKAYYCFPALNSSCTKDTRSPIGYFIMYILFLSVSVSTVFLNLLVIISISHFKPLLTQTNLFILSLAVADLLVGLFVMPVESITLIETCWYLGDTFCYIFPYITFAVVIVSMNNIVLISIDIVVCDPLRYTLSVTHRKSALCVCLIWCASLACALLILHDHILYPDPHRTCQCLFIIHLPWIVFDLLVSFAITCSIVIGLNVKIFCTAKHQAQVISSFKARVKAGHANRMIEKYNSKATKTIGILVYLLSYMPYYASIPFQGSFTSASLVANILLFYKSNYV